MRIDNIAAPHYISTMQIILNTPPENVVCFTEHDFSTDKFYGVQMPDGRGFVRQEKWCAGTFSVYAIDGFTHSNGWSFRGNSVKELTNELLKYKVNRGEKKIEVHVFDTFAELANFLVDGAD